MAGERELTAGLARFFGAGPALPVGIGDDAAVVPNRAKSSVVCCDPVIEGVHYRRRDAPVLVGRKAVNRNLSDLAAMGALPDWLLVSLVLRRGLPGDAVDGLLRGIRGAARAASCRVVGGDVAVVRGPTVITVTAIGHLAAARALRRSGARAGDHLHVTGPLGGSSAGQHLRFRPALREGAWLARQRAATAAIDVSDGLLLDLATLLSASSARGQHLGAELIAGAIPVRAAARQLAGGDPARALRRALGDGEDHALLFCRRRALPDGGPLTARARRPIGRVTPGGGLWLVHRDGQRQPLRPVGFEHRIG